MALKPSASGPRATLPRRARAPVGTERTPWRARVREEAGQHDFFQGFVGKFELSGEKFEYQNWSSNFPLQYLQRPTYGLVNGLARNASRKSTFARLKTLFKWPLTDSLSFETSKFEMLPMVKVVSLETTNNFCIGGFWSIYAKFGERAKSSRNGHGQ
jgi:hypothetical protein